MNKLILVIDDEPQIQKLVSRLLHYADYDVISVGTAKEALELVAQEIFGCILLDICMPEMDGNEFLQELQKQESDVPVIVMSGTPELLMPTPQVKGLLAKPFTRNELVDAVASVTLYSLAS